MGIVLGKIDVEMPDHKVVHDDSQGFQIWRYPSSVAAVVRADSLAKENPPTGDQFTNQAFRALARYIGVFNKPENVANSQDPEKLAMTAPVLTTPAASEAESAKIAMTAPVLMTPATSGPDGEKIAMTAPVVMTPAGGTSDSENIAMTGPVLLGDAGESMAFLLPSKYATVEQAPKPTNSAVTIQMMPARYEAVLQFSGNFPSSDRAKREAKVNELLALMHNAGIQATGQYTFAGYNPPMTLPWLKRNEVHIPVDGSKYEN